MTNINTFKTLKSVIIDKIVFFPICRRANLGQVPARSLDRVWGNTNNLKFFIKLNSRQQPGVTKTGNHNPFPNHLSSAGNQGIIADTFPYAVISGTVFLTSVINKRYADKKEHYVIATRLA